MKTKVTLLLIAIFLFGKSFSQYGTEEVALIGGMKFRYDLMVGADTVTVSSLEFGFGRAGGNRKLEWENQKIHKKQTLFSNRSSSYEISLPCCW